MKTYSRRRLAKAIVELLKRYSLSQVASAAASELRARRRTQDAELLLNEVGRLLAAQGHLTATVVSARVLPATTVASIKRFLQDRLEVERVTIVTKTDGALVGGAVVQTPSVEIDMSLRQKLNELYAHV